MAIFHLHARTAQKGMQSAAASDAYVRRQGKYARRGGVQAIGSGNLPVWAEDDAATFWKAVDTYERKNARLFKSLEIALPRELNSEQRLDLVQEFCTKIAKVPEGLLPYTYAIHTDPKDSNPHFHLMLSERVTDAINRGSAGHFKRAAPKGKDPVAGGARKTEALKPREWLVETRALWAKMANSALEKAGSYAEISPLSLAAQGIVMYPQPHLGPNVKAMAKKGKNTRKMQEYCEKSEDRAVPVVNPVIEELEDFLADYEDEMDRTLDAVRNQARAMGCNDFYIGIRPLLRSGLLEKHYTTDQLEKALGFLKARNMQDNDIYIRPAAADAPLVLIDDLTWEQATLDLVRAGLEPACVVQTSPTERGFQVWIKLGSEPVPEDVKSEIAKRLAKEWNADKASASAKHFGRLAGFTNRKPKHQDQTTGQHPFALCRRSSGCIATRCQELIREAEAALAAKKGASEKTALRSNIAPADRISEGFDEDCRTGALFVRYWKEWEARQLGALDRSAGDYAAASRLLKEGHAPAAVVAAIEAHSPDLIERKGEKWARVYAERTVTSALVKIRRVATTVNEEIVSEEENSGLTPER